MWECGQDLLKSYERIIAELVFNFNLKATYFALNIVIVQFNSFRLVVRSILVAFGLICIPLEALKAVSKGSIP